MDTVTTFESEVQEIINDCTLNGKTIQLPDILLERSLYEAVADKLQKIGGKWNTKANGFIFKHDPANLLSKLKAGQTVNFQKDFQFFGTPDSLADYLVEHAYLSTDYKVLEPSAGHGSIINAIHRRNPEIVVDYCEIADESRAILEQINNTRFMGADFLEQDLTAQYNVIIANPPFTKNQDIDHVRKMFSSLVPGGILVSIMSRSWLTKSNKKETEFRQWLGSQNATIEYIDAGEFKESGTSVATCFVVIHNRPKREESYSHTGATSYAVNDLILFAESTSNLYHDLNALYRQAATNQETEESHSFQFRITQFIKKAKDQYCDEMPESCGHIRIMTQQQDKEVLNLLASGLEGWKTDNL